MLEDSDKAWHLDKRISISHIIATLTVATGALWWGATVETRLAERIGADLVHDSQLRALQHSQLAANDVVTDRLNRIEEKLDRLIEAQINRWDSQER